MPIKQTFIVAGEEFTGVLSRKTAIKMACKDCCAGSWNEVKACHIETCPLHSFRLGGDPNRVKRAMPDDQKIAMVDRLKIARELKKATQE